jgi:hypothetical protein
MKMRDFEKLAGPLIASSIIEIVIKAILKTIIKAVL